MRRTVSVAQATSDEALLPQRVQEALGQLVGAAREGLLALSVGVGLGVLSELMEEEVDEVVGPKGKHNPDRREDGVVFRVGTGVRLIRPRSARGAARPDRRPRDERSRAWAGKTPGAP